MVASARPGSSSTTRSLDTLSSHTDGKKMVKRSPLKTWLKVRAEARLDMRRSNSAANRPLEMAYNTSGWTVVALRSRVIPNSRSRSTPCFAGTIALKSATCTCLTSLQGRGKEGTTSRRIHRNRLFGKVNGLLEAGLFKSCLLLDRLNSLLERTSDLVISSLSSNISII
jgi:hypothetical protein